MPEFPAQSPLQVEFPSAGVQGFTLRSYPSFPLGVRVLLGAVSALILIKTPAPHVNYIFGHYVAAPFAVTETSPTQGFGNYKVHTSCLSLQAYKTVIVRLSVTVCNIKEIYKRWLVVYSRDPEYDEVNKFLKTILLLRKLKA